MSFQCPQLPVLTLDTVYAGSLMTEQPEPLYSMKRSLKNKKFTVTNLLVLLQPMFIADLPMCQHWWSTEYEMEKTQFLPLGNSQSFGDTKQEEISSLKDSVGKGLITEGDAWTQTCGGGNYRKSWPVRWRTLQRGVAVRHKTDTFAV